MRQHLASTPARRRERACALVAAACMLSPTAGCTTSYTPLPPEPARANAEAPARLELQTRVVSKLELGWDSWLDLEGKGHAESAAASIWKSGWAVPATGDGATEAVLTIRSYQGSPSPGIAALTLYAIPAVAETLVEVELATRNELGERVCRKSQIRRAWSQLFLMFVAPFRSDPFTMSARSIDRLAVACAAELFAQPPLP